MGSDESGNVIESKSDESLGFKEDAQPSKSVVDDAEPSESAGAKAAATDKQPSEAESGDAKESKDDGSLGFQEDARPSEPGVSKAETSESAVAKPAGDKAQSSDAAAEGAQDSMPAQEAGSTQQKPVFLAGRRFSNRAELVEHVRKIQEKFADADGSKGELSNSDNLFIFHLLLHHPKAMEKLTTPMSHFRYGVYDKFLNKCFISVGADGSQEGVSAMKSVHSVFPSSGAKVEGTAGLVASSTERGTKREREPKPEYERRPFEPQEVIKGVVIDIKGLPDKPHYHRLKEQLSAFGPVRHLSLQKAPKAPKAESQQRPAKKAKTDASGEVEAGEEDCEEEQEEEEEEEDEEESPTTARCRFEEAEGAKAAIAGLKDTEVQGAKVEVVLLEGAVEEAFWEETNMKLKEAYENPKPKGKGFDKGKKKGKGKGKSKGGKGKKKDGGLKMVE